MHDHQVHTDNQETTNQRTESQSQATNKENSHPKTSDRRDQKQDLRRALFTNILSNSQSTNSSTQQGFSTPLKAQNTFSPAGIMRTPGTIGAKKAVKFAASVAPENETAVPRIKSGLPKNFPGKFPSPFTPRSSFTDVYGDDNLEDTPTLSHTRRQKYKPSRNLFSAGERIETEGKRHTPLAIPNPEIGQSVLEQPNSDKSCTGSTEAFKVTFLGLNERLPTIYSTILDNNACLRQLVNNTESKEAVCAEETDLENNSPDFWKLQYEKMKQERIQLELSLEEIQNHAEEMASYAEMQGQQIIQLKDQLAIESKYNKENEHLIKQLSRDMQLLKIKSSKSHVRKESAVKN
ncbi:uncharacterized protein V1510DRAFT_420182 [Dipodascopsis tothii]|uniref:uncharacterized protein n=1 Tax=Dipodascopsis tothii TaxID=44089 RepID=UPI0034CD3D91